MPSTPRPGCSRRPLRVRCGWTPPPTAGRRGHRVRRHRRARAEGQVRAGAPVGRHPGALRGGRVPARRRARGAARWAATPSCERSRSCSMPVPSDARLGWCSCRDRPGWASPGSGGSSRSTSTGWPSGIYWHRGRCLSYGEGVAFWALTEIVRQRLGIAEEDPSETAATKLAEGLETFVPDASERAYVGPRAGTAPRGDGRRRYRRQLWRARSCSPGGGCSSSAWPRAIPSSSSSRTPSTPTPECSTSWTTWSIGLGTRRSSCWCSPAPSSTIPARVRDRPQPLHAHSRSSRRRVDGRLDRRSGTGHAQTPRAAISRPSGGHSRCSRWRRCAPWSTVTSSCHATASTAWSATWGRCRYPTACAPCSRRAWMPWIPTCVRWWPRRRCLAPPSRRVPRGRLRPGRGVGARPVWPSCCAVRCCRSPLIGSRPSAGTTASPRDLLRQVAYETMSRRDRKARHLAVATHLRAVLPGRRRRGGRGHLAALSRCARGGARCPRRTSTFAPTPSTCWCGPPNGPYERCAPRAAASSYVSAAQQTELSVGPIGRTTPTGRRARLWELAARAASTAFDLEGSLAYAEHASELYVAARTAPGRGARPGPGRRGAAASGAPRRSPRAAARRLGRAPPDPDADTVDRAATISPPRRSSRGARRRCAVGRSPCPGPGARGRRRPLADLLIGRGLALNFADRWAEAAAALDYAAKLAEGAGDSARRPEPFSTWLTC